MSFGISAAGTVEQVRAQLQAAECYGDRTQFDVVRAFLFAELDAWPTSNRHGYDLGLWAEANGHHDEHSRNVRVTVTPLWLPHTETGS